MISQAHRLGLDRDAAFALQVHLVEELVGLFAIGQGTGHFQQAVGQGRFAVIDVGNNGEIADLRLFHRL